MLCLKIHVGIVCCTNIVANTAWKSDEYNNIGSLALIIAGNQSPHTSESDQISPLFSHAIVFIGLLRSQS